MVRLARVLVFGQYTYAREDGVRLNFGPNPAGALQGWAFPSGMSVRLAYSAFGQLQPVGWVEPTGPAQAAGPMTGSTKPIAAAVLLCSVDGQLPTQFPHRAQLLLYGESGRAPAASAHDACLLSSERRQNGAADDAAGA